MATSGRVTAVVVTRSPEATSRVIAIRVDHANLIPIAATPAIIRLLLTPAAILLLRVNEETCYRGERRFCIAGCIGFRIMASARIKGMLCCKQRQVERAQCHGSLS